MWWTPWPPQASVWILILFLQPNFLNQRPSLLPPPLFHTLNLSLAHIKRQPPNVRPSPLTEQLSSSVSTLCSWISIAQSLCKSWSKSQSTMQITHLTGVHFENENFHMKNAVFRLLWNWASPCSQSATKFWAEMEREPPPHVESPGPRGVVLVPKDSSLYWKCLPEKFSWEHSFNNSLPKASKLEQKWFIPSTVLM